MDIQSWIVGNSVAIILAIIGGIVWVNTQNSERKSDNSLVRQDLDNHKENHKALEKRVTEHESKIDQKLEMISGKVDDLKDLIIEKMK